MWVAKIKIYPKNGLFSTRTKKYGVTASGYPISIFEKDKELYVYFVGMVLGKKAAESSS